MKKLLFIFSCLVLSFSSQASKKLPDFETLKNKMENFGLLSAKEWKDTGNTNIAIINGSQYWSNDKAIAAIFSLKGNREELDEKLLDTATKCLKISRAAMGELTEEQANDVLLTIGYSGKVDDRQVSTFINGYSFFSSLQPSNTTSEIVFTCGVRQNDF